MERNQKRPLKICFIVDYYYPHIGGVEIVFQNIAEKMVKKGHECYLLTTNSKKVTQKENKNGVLIYRINIPQRGDRYWFSLLSIPIAFSIVRKCDLIHTTTYNSALPGLLAAKLFSKPSIVVFHEIHEKKWFTFGMGNVSALIHYILEFLIVKAPFTKKVSVSEYTRRSATKLKERNTSVIYNGVKEDMFFPREKNIELRKKLNIDDKFVYLYYGRPGISKGVESLIRAIPVIKKGIPNSKLVLLMSKVPHNGYTKIIKMIQQKGLENDLIRLNPVKQKDLPDYLAIADCIVVPSLSEGFGFTTIESCSMDIPVVASKYGSIPEVVSGKHVLVDPKNPESIAQGVMKIKNGLWKETEKKDFNWDNAADEYEKLYYNLVISESRVNHPLPRPSGRVKGLVE